MPAASPVAKKRPPSQQVRWFVNCPVPYVPNQQVNNQTDIARGNSYREFYLRLQGQITVTPTAETGTQLAPGNISAGEVWDLITNVQLVINGSDTIRTLSGYELKMLNQYLYYSQPRPIQWFPQPSGQTAQVINFNQTLIIPAWILNNSKRPIDTLLNASLTSSVQLKVTWGNINNVISSAYAGGTVAFTVAPTLTLESLQSFVPGSQPSYMQLLQARKIDTSTFAGGAVNRAQVKLDIGYLYRSFLIHTQSPLSITGDNTGLTPDLPSPLSAIRVKSGQTSFVDQTAEVIQMIGRQKIGSKTDLLDATGTPVDFNGLSATENFSHDSWYWLDLVTDGYTSETIDTRGFTDFVLEFDTVEAIAQMTILPLQLIPIRA